MPKIFICKICGDAYLGEEPPSNCPFCGAHKEFIKVDNKWDIPEEPIKDITDKTKANFNAAIKTEIRNAGFYEAAAKKVQDIKLQKLFKLLKKVELEHASIFRKALGINENPTAEFELKESDLENLEQAKAYEEDAINHYKEFLEEATEQRAREIFAALIKVEEDHLAVETEKIDASK